MPSKENNQKKDEKKEIKVEYDDDNGKHYELWVSLQELLVMINNWAGTEKRFPDNLQLKIQPLSSSN